MVGLLQHPPSSRHGGDDAEYQHQEYAVGETHTRLRLTVDAETLARIHDCAREHQHGPEDDHRARDQRPVTAWRERMIRNRATPTARSGQRAHDLATAVAVPRIRSDSTPTLRASDLGRLDRYRHDRKKRHAQQPNDAIATPRRARRRFHSVSMGALPAVAVSAMRRNLCRDSADCNTDSDAPAARRPSAAPGGRSHAAAAGSCLRWRQKPGASQPGVSACRGSIDASTAGPQAVGVGPRFVLAAGEFVSTVWGVAGAGMPAPPLAAGRSAWPLGGRRAPRAAVGNEVVELTRRPGCLKASGIPGVAAWS